MKQEIYLAIIFVLLLVFITPVFLVFGIKYIPSGIQPSLGNTKKIYKDIVLSQSFISLQDNLGGIGVSIKNPNFANKKVAYFQLLDSEEKVIRSLNLNGQNIADGKFVKILFEPVADSKGREFIWTFSSPESVFEDALEIFLTENPPLWNLNSEDVLSYVTLHKVTNPLEVLKIISSGWINNFFKDVPFFIVYTSILLSLSGSLIYLKLKK